MPCDEKHRKAVYGRKPYVGFEEGGQAIITMIRLLRHGQTKGAETGKFDLPVHNTCFLLFYF